LHHRIMKILLVDEHTMFREGLKTLLDAESDFDVVGEASTAQEAIEKVASLRPDLLLMDLSLPDSGGLEAIDEILAIDPDISVVILTVLETDENILDAIRAGAKGYVLKNMPVSSLLSSLRALQRGETALSRNMVTRVVEDYKRLSQRPEPEQEEFDSLTRRELEVLELLVQGDTNIEIANKLNISENTVKNHVHNLLKKLDVKTRIQAANLARRYKLVSDDHFNLS
jgi:DNA-binding NarL/FixJ family response regulator